MAVDLTQLQYPIGRFARPEGEISISDRSRAVAELAGLPAELRKALAGVAEADLETPYRPGGWTVRQVVHHLADSHMHSYIRCKLALTASEPTISVYDERRWAELPDNRAPVESSLELLNGLHRRWCALFESLSEADWHRRYVHPERGPNDLATTALLYAWHGKHHLAHVHNALSR